MRVVDANRNELTDFDLEKGCIYEAEIITGLTDDGNDIWETVQVYEPYTEEQLDMMEEQKRLQIEREEQAAAAAASVEYFSALTSAFGGE